MKKSLLFSILGGALALTACDSVSEPDRFIPAEIVPQRSILIEEFTGQNCKNCPDGHQAIQEITAQLGDSVVAVGVHASILAYNPPTGLKTDTGEEYYKRAGSPALPSAVINMQTSPLQVPEWGAAIERLIMTPTDFTVRAHGDADGDNYNIEVAVSAGDNYSGRLMVWICENDIQRVQNYYGEMRPDYIHNHVFRAAATEDIWGEQVELKAHKPQYFTYSYPIGARWTADNLYVVAFLYDDSGVQQVTQSVSH